MARTFSWETFSYYGCGQSGDKYIASFTDEELLANGLSQELIDSARKQAAMTAEEYSDYRRSIADDLSEAAEEAWMEEQ